MLILTIWFVLVVFPSSIRTYIQRADLIFLLPAESELSAYFRKAIQDSWIRQSIVLIFAAAIGMPLYLKTVDPSSNHYFIAVILFILLKGWNIYGVWAEARTDTRFPYQFLRFLITFMFIYMVFSKVSWLVLTCLLIVLVGFLWFAERPLLIREPMNWIDLAEEESRQAMRILRIANWVTDVPGLEQPVKSRPYLNFLASIWKGRGQPSVYPLLFLKTFSRTGDYFGLYIRLTLVGAVLIVVVQSAPMIAILVFGLSLFLTAFQLLSLVRHDFPAALEGLYPLDDPMKRQGFLKVIRILVGIQSVILSLLFLAVTQMLLPFIGMLILGFLLSILWIQMLSRKKIEPI